MTFQLLPTLFVPHGAGPCFFMDWTPADTWSKMASWLRSVPELIGSQPKALLLISGHWEAPRFTVNAQVAPPLLYDYAGFPPHMRQPDHPNSLLGCRHCWMQSASTTRKSIPAAWITVYSSR